MGKRQASKTPNKKKQKDDSTSGKKAQRKPRPVAWHLASIILICLVGVIAYSNSFDCSFHFDDGLTIEGNVAIRSLSNIKAWWNFVPSRPIGTLSFALNYHFNKLDVWGYHLVNLVIHIVNAILVWWLVMLTMSTPVMRGQPIAKYKGAMALFTALLFVSHPLATQSVTYIVQRLASLATLFYLLSLALYVKGRLGAGNKDKYGLFFYTGSIVCAVLGMLTKEIVFTLPFALVLYEFSFMKSDTWRVDLKDRGIQIPALIFVIFVILFFINFSLDIFKPIPPLLYQGYDYPITAWEYFLTQFSVMLTYIRLFIVPVNQNLDYDYPVSHNLFEWQTLIGLVSLAGIVLLGIYLFRRYRLIAFGIFWFFLTLSVESSIIPISQNVIFEHRTYLPSLGFFLVLTGILFHFLYGRYKQVALVIMALMVLTGTVLTYERNKVWKSLYTLAYDDIKKSPNKARTLCDFGTALLEAGNVSEALTYYDKAILISPHYYLAYYNRGKVKTELGDYKKAIGDFDSAIKINPGYARAYNNRGGAYVNLGNSKQAIGDFNKAIEIDPTYTEAYYNRGIAYNSLGNYKQAIGDYDKAIEIDPTYAEAYNNRGTVYWSLGNFEKAIEDLKIASKLGNKASQDFLKGNGISW